MQRVTLKQIARDLGLSTQTVSVALRGRPGVSEAVRNQIRARAAAMGYAPDPAMRALADYRTRNRKTAPRWSRVALVHNWPSEHALEENPFYQRWLAELRRAARDRGIEIELHWLGGGGERTPAVFRLLRNRGITGVLVAPPGLSPDPPRLIIPRNQFQVVTFGPEHLFPDLHTVQFDFYENLRMAWRKLRERGHERIGLVYGTVQAWRTGHAWSAAYQIETLLSGFPPGKHMPLELNGMNAASDRDTYLRWVKKHRYSAVISSIHWTANTRRPCDPGPETAIINVQNRGEMGIDLNLPQLADTAVELLVLEMQRSLVREQPLPFRIHIPGRWVDPPPPRERAVSPPVSRDVSV
jgi:LacI family transcriptional regulator